MRKPNKAEYSLKEYVRKFSDEDIRYLFPKLTQRIGGDLSDALVFIQDKHVDVNKVLTQAGNADAVYDIIDLLDKSVQNEYAKRFMTAKAG